MSIWFLLAISNAFCFSAYNAYSKFVISRAQLSKFAVIFLSSVISSMILFAVSYIVGFPNLDGQFWIAALITGLINSAAGPILLRAYELGEFSQVFSMSLLTPVFLLVTSFFILGEVPHWLGAVGVVLTVVGLWFVEKSSGATEVYPGDQAGKINRGTLMAVGVALSWSISANFDKLAAQHSSAFFAPAVTLAMMSVTSGLYLIFSGKWRAVFSDNVGLRDFGLVVPMGLLSALSNIFFNLALIIGLASYTISVKRMGILFGIIWGWMFFKEKNISKKLVGALIAIGGVVLILFS